MKPINYAGFTHRILGPGGENDPNVLPLPAHYDGLVVTSCWELTDAEIAEITKNRYFFFQVWCGKTIPPVRPIVYPEQLPFVIQYPDSAYHTFHYVNENTGKGIRIFISIDSLPPYAFITDNGNYFLNHEGISRKIGANAPLDKGDLYLRWATGDELNDGFTPHVVARKEAGGKETVFKVIYPDPALLDDKIPAE